MEGVLNHKYNTVEPLTFEPDGHYHMKIPVLRKEGSYTNVQTDFVFDTGAFLTVMTHKTVRSLGLYNMPTVVANAPLSGFAGECNVDIKRIPGLVIGGRLLEDVKVAIPRSDTKSDLQSDLLGLNVLDYFKYFVDTDADEVYFADNPNPSVKLPLRCGRISLISDSRILGRPMPQPPVVSDTYNLEETKQILLRFISVTGSMTFDEDAEDYKIEKQKRFTCLGEAANLLAAEGLIVKDHTIPNRYCLKR